MDELSATPDCVPRTGLGLVRNWSAGRLGSLGEVALLVLVFFVVAGDAPPMVNEAHYLVKAKNFWDPQWCRSDLFAASGKEHTAFYALFGWPTRWISLAATAWIGRLVGWTLLAAGLAELCWQLLGQRYLSLVVAVVWIAGVQYGNLAGEWVVGGIEAKVPAYALVLMALSQLVRRRWGAVWILLGAASAFHVLTGGWSVVAAMIAWWFTERGRDDAARLITPALALGGAISLLGLVPAMALTAAASAEEATAAARIYSYHRIRHHLLPAGLATSWYIRHGVLIVATAAAAAWIVPHCHRFRRIGWFAAGAVMIALAGLAVGTLTPRWPDLAAKLLRFYWFRLSDAIVPLMMALLAGRMIFETRRPARFCGVGLALLAIGLVGMSSYSAARLAVPPSASNDLLGLDSGALRSVQRQVFRDWLAVCRWARTSSGPDEVFLTPRHQQTFKWYAERAEVVNWKDVPQDAASLGEWYGRFQDVFPQRLGHVRVTVQYAKLRQYRRQFGVRFLIVDRRVVGDHLPLVQVYPTAAETNPTYAVYELPSFESPD